MTQRRPRGLERVKVEADEQAVWACLRKDRLRVTAATERSVDDDRAGLEIETTEGFGEKNGLVVIRGHHSGRLSSNGPLGLLGWQFARRIASSARPRRVEEECRREEDGALRGTIFGTYPPVTAPETLCVPETPQPLSWKATIGFYI